MIRRVGWAALQVAGALLAGLVLLLAFVTWRLTNEGPIHLRFLRPYVEHALNAGARQYGFTINDVVLAWAGWEGVIDVRALNVKVLDAEGEELAIVPEVSFGLSGEALRLGLVAPSRIEIFRPELALLRNEDGDFQFGATILENADSPRVLPGRGARVLQAIVGELMRPPEPEKGTGYLREAVIRDARIAIDDLRGQSQWSVENLTITFRRSESGVAGSLDAAIPQFGGPARITGTLNFPADSDRISLDVQVAQFNAAAMTKLEAGMMVLRGAEVSLAGRVTTSIGLDGSVGQTVFNLTGGPGTIALAGIMKDSLPVKAMVAEGIADPDQDLIKLANLTLDLDGPHFELTGEGRGFFAGRLPDGGPPRLEATLTGGNLDWSKVDGWWPMGVADDTRAWVIPNITEGIVEGIDGLIALRVPTLIDTPVTLEKLTGRFDASGLIVHYLRPLAPIEGGAAKATITATDFSAAILGGHVGAIGIEGGQLRISGLDQEDQFISVGGVIVSPVLDALQLLDDPFLGYAGKLGIRPESGSGDAKAWLQFDFPAEKDLGFDKVKIQVLARLENLGLKQIALKQDVTEGALDLALTQDGMKITGPLKFGPIPIDLQWLEHFSDEAPFRQQIRAIGEITSEQRSTFGYDIAPFVDGPVGTDLTFISRAGGKGRLDVELDLSKAEMAVDFLKWRKPQDAPGALTATLLVEKGRITDVPRFDLDAADLTTAGAIAMSEEGGPRHLTLPEIRFGRSEMTDVAVDFDHEWINVAIGGGELDAEPWMAGNAEEPLDDAAQDLADKEPGVPFRVTAKHLAKVRIGEGRHLEDVTVKLVHDPFWWDVIDVEAKLENGAALRFDYRPADGGTHRLTATASDGGEALRVLDIYDSIRGGELSISGAVKDDDPRRPLRGRLEATSFRLINTPFFVRLLSVAALTGLADALTGEGFYFDGASARFTKARGLVKVQSFRSAGPSIGMTSKGTLDLDRNKVELEGVLVPAYALNTILGNIPVLGDLLLGGGGEGLFSATYAITGDLGEPEIDVNPWAALAPGILRDLFTMDADGNGASLPPKSGNDK